MTKSWEDVVKKRVGDITRTHGDTSTTPVMSDDAMLSSGICPNCKQRTSRVPEDMNEVRCLDCGLQWHNMGSTWCEAEFTGRDQQELDKAMKEAIKNIKNKPINDRLRGVQPTKSARTYRY